LSLSRDGQEREFAHAIGPPNWFHDQTNVQFESKPLTEPLTTAERRRELLLAVSFLLAAAALAVLLEPASDWDAPRALLLVTAFAVAARIELDVGAGYTVPTQLVFVPMLLLLPTSWVPLLVAAGWLLAKLSEVLAGTTHPQRLVVAFGNSWFAIGPALVLILMDAEHPDWSLWPAYLLALVAQFGGDLAAATVREGARSPLARELISGVYVIDVLLTGPALAAAFAARDARFAFVAVLPGVLLFVLFGRERTRRLHDALALAERSEQTAELAEKLLESEREATRVREGVLAGASAEMLTPLGRLTALIYRVRRDSGAEERAAHLSEMEREVQQLRHSAGQFIDYSVLKAGRELAVEPRRTDLARIVRGATVAWPPAAGIRVEMPDDLPEVMADEGRVLQMLMSLISNAVKYSPPRAPVRVAVQAGREAVSVSITDEGPGIPERERERIFNELRRGSTSSGTEGAGLGLYLSRRIAEASGAELLLRTQEGAGSTFTLVLPRAD
jgi:signal transduction histidine kinase